MLNQQVRHKHLFKMRENPTISLFTNDMFPVSSGLPCVRFLCGVTEVLKPERWVFKSGSGIYLSRQQLPLKLAWAISIHKSQVSSRIVLVQKTLFSVVMGHQCFVSFSQMNDSLDE